MWSMIVSLVQGIVTGVVGPVFTYLGKKQDTTLAGFQSAVTADVSQAAAQQAFIEATNAEKAQANAWWGPRFLYMLVGTAAALHTAAIFARQHRALRLRPLRLPRRSGASWRLRRLRADDRLLALRRLHDRGAGVGRHGLAPQEVAAVPRPANDMGGRLAATLRKTFAPAHLLEAEQAAIEARMAALCVRIDAIGEDRRATPFRDIPEHR